MNLKRSSLSYLPESAGVYLFKDDEGQILYIGKAINLKSRIKSYFQNKSTDNKSIRLQNLAFNLETIRVDNEFEALLLEADLIKRYQPKLNVILKDDKHYIYIKITKETFPRVIYSRKKDDKKAVFFGPYPSAGTVRQIITLLRRIFPFCNQKRNSSRPCFYSHIGLCNPCTAEIMKLRGEKYAQNKKIYRHNINLLMQVLNGKLNTVEKSLTRQMNSFAKKKEYEKAAVIRDKLNKLSYITKNYHAPETYLENNEQIDQIRQNEIKSLQIILSKYYANVALAITIECYDISNISGRLATGSLVTFKNGEPAKDFYKRFRIRTLSTPNDFAMLKEVFDRRLKHKEWLLPDLIIVDGGVPQVSVVSRILEEKNLPVPLIGLAKKEEKIIVKRNGTFSSISLPIGSPALSLIQRLRDEAHRFAHKYHEYLRLKYLLQ